MEMLQMLQVYYQAFKVLLNNCKVSSCGIYI
ncbi:hypothetical protein F8388_018216 [Cannabis sativa]|uniref:Uncharacterized protein n=1 Tax=Cannabis sativa TaxID=3483 RepID=A0A7J6GBB3_CANSA|nr:hypothetical protein F8388_018216 [Cannabis sativa]